MTGGSGADIVEFGAIAESAPSIAGRDRILDFLVNVDLIDLSEIDAVAGGANNSFVFRGTAAFTAAGQIRLAQFGADTIVEINTVGVSGAEMKIQIDSVTATTMHAGDFLL